jgi:hypothetical protein
MKLAERKRNPWDRKAAQESDILAGRICSSLSSNGFEDGANDKWCEEEA